MDNNQKPQQQLQLNLRPEIARGEYSNLALITHSHTDFILDFARHLPGMQQPEVCSRVIMAPEHAKRLLGALQENIYKYEQQFGKIEIPGQPQRTIAPFGTVAATPNASIGIGVFSMKNASVTRE